MKDLKTEITNLIEPILADEGFDLVEVKLAHFKNRYRLQVFVDSDHGVTIDDCVHLSRLIGAATDTNNVFERQYILDVSSPGIDRPLRSDRDYKRRIGREIRLDVLQDGREKKIRGVLTGVEDSVLTLTVDDGTVQVALADVQAGKEII